MCLVYCVFTVVMWVIVLIFDLWLCCFSVDLLFVAGIELVFADCCCDVYDLV